jgi:uncharacterized membrane protein YdbT with pleckstrin-like domain
MWRGHPWIVPAFVGDTIAAIAVAIALTWLELTFKFAYVSVFSFPVLALTYAVILLVWMVSVLHLLVIRASSVYTLRASSLEIRHGILGKKIFTISAAGFSDLEVIQSIWGRILHVGNIIVETDSHRDLRLAKVRDPVPVSAMIRRVMTAPMVRVEPGSMPQNSAD